MIKMEEKKIESIITIFISPPDFDGMNEEAQDYFIARMKDAMTKFTPLKKIPIKGSKDFYLRVKSPELWDYQITYSNNGEQVLKQIFYEGYE